MEFLKKLFGNKPKINIEEAKRSLELKVSSLRRPAIRLIKNQQATRSKFGGKPFVNPNGFQWPKSNDAPMAFLAQLDLTELASVYKFEWLGDHGSLLFFYDVAEMPGDLIQMIEENGVFSFKCILKSMLNSQQA